MFGYLLKRLIQMTLVLWIVSVIVFLMMSFTGDPVFMVVPIDATDAEIAQARRIQRHRRKGELEGRAHGETFVTAIGVNEALVRRMQGKAQPPAGSRFDFGNPRCKILLRGRCSGVALFRRTLGIDAAGCRCKQQGEEKSPHPPGQRKLSA